ncbi:hypothetical protein K443DRAFT_56807, partial [Laccaria amethystina LaAM-08-1]
KAGLGNSPLTSLDSEPFNLTWALNLLKVHTIQRIKHLAHCQTCLREPPSFDIPPLPGLLKMEKRCTEHG